MDKKPVIHSMKKEMRVSEDYSDNVNDVSINSTRQEAKKRKI